MLRSRTISEIKSAPVKVRKPRRGPRIRIIHTYVKTDQEIARSNASPATSKQINYMRNLLGGCSTECACDFVCWANGLFPGTGSLNRWDQRPPMRKLWLSSYYWRQAIDMALTGSNDYFTAEELIKGSEEP